MPQQDLAPLAHAVPDACQRLGISRSTLYELIASGEIRSFKVGARTLIPEAELRKFIASKMQSPSGSIADDNAA